ncbi:MAG: cell division protein ZapA [Novosphingobium sp.]
MSNVTLTIAGRDYVVACAEGEEAQVTALGRVIDAKLQSMGGHETQGEMRNLLFASLLLADEVQELRRGGGTGPAPAAPATDDRVAETLERIAARLEACASALEG